MWTAAIPVRHNRISFARLSGNVRVKRGREKTSTNLASQNVRDPHLIVIDDVRKVVRRQAVRLAQDKVLEGERVVVDRVVDHVPLRQGTGRTLLAGVSAPPDGNSAAAAAELAAHLESNNVALASLQPFLNLLLRQSKASPVVALMGSFPLEPFARLGESLWCAEAVVGASGLVVHTMRETVSVR